MKQLLHLSLNIWYKHILNMHSIIIFIIVQINVYLIGWCSLLWDSMKRACFSFFEILSHLDGELQASIRMSFWSSLIISSLLFFLVFPTFWSDCLLTYPDVSDIWSTDEMLCSWRMFPWTFWTWVEGIVPSFFIWESSKTLALWSELNSSIFRSKPASFPASSSSSDSRTIYCLSNWSLLMMFVTSLQILKLFQQ